MHIDIQILESKILDVVWSNRKEAKVIEEGRRILIIRSLLTL